MLNLFLAVFAVFGITIALNKKQYITYNIYDILTKYKINQRITKMIILISSSYILFFICLIVSAT